MRTVKIMTDSCSDLTGELMDRYHIDYAQMNTVYQGKETPASLRWEYYTPKELYDIMRGGERITTTQVPADRFREKFAQYAEEGCDVVYVGCSLRLSGSVNTAAVVAKEFKEKYPDMQIFCVDSRSACMGEGALAIYAAELRDKGLTAAEINADLEKNRNRMNQFVTVNSLDALKRAGRVKASAAFFGNLLGVKPILISDANGQNVPIVKAKGRKNSMMELVRRLKETITEPEKQTVYLVHADCDPEEVQYLVDLVKQEIPVKDVHVGYIGPIIGASIGPSAIGLFAFGQEVTYTA